MNVYRLTSRDDIMVPQGDAMISLETYGGALQHPSKCYVHKKQEKIEINCRDQLQIG